MVTIKLTKDGETISLQAPQGMTQATDEQVLSYVNEATNIVPAINADEFQVERTAEGIVVHPAPQYG